MSTLALPMFLGCFRMSERRRHLVPSPTPNEDRSSDQAQVRRNLFGPIDHEENLKFVQNELTKIAQADMKRWNFDFKEEKPHEGRYSWEPVVEGVPSAYEMKRLNYISLSSICGGSTTTTPLTTTTSSVSSSSVSPSVPECSTTTTTAPSLTKTSATAASTSDKPTFKTSKLNQPSCSKDTKSSSEIVKQCRPKNNTRSDLTLDSKKDKREKGLSQVKNNSKKSSQTQIPAFMPIRKPKRAASTKLEDDQPPALVKRPKTTTS